MAGEAVTETAPLAVFRADASPAIGGGHVMRSLTLADGLARAGWRCALATRSETLTTLPGLAHCDHVLIELSGDDEAAAIGARLNTEAQWLIVDHYERDADFHRACRPWARRILVIDDLADRIYDCDMLLDATPGRAVADYHVYVPGDCRLLLGPAYALLRPQFPAARSVVLERREQIDQIRSILISFGTLDTDNLTAVALHGLAAAGYPGRVDVVLGSGASHVREVRSLAERLPFPVTIHESTSDMAGLMAAADLAVGAAGTTSWERCCVGLPALMVVAAGNQRNIARRLSEAGAGITISDSADFTEETMAQAYTAVAGDITRLRTMARAAAGVCDGRGAGRVIENMTTT